MEGVLSDISSDSRSQTGTGNGQMQQPLSLQLQAGAVAASSSGTVALVGPVTPPGGNSKRAYTRYKEFEVAKRSTPPGITPADPALYGIPSPRESDPDLVEVVANYVGQVSQHAPYPPVRPTPGAGAYSRLTFVFRQGTATFGAKRESLYTRNATAPVLYLRCANYALGCKWKCRLRVCVPVPLAGQPEFISPASYTYIRHPQQVPHLSQCFALNRLRVAEGRPLDHPLGKLHSTYEVQRLLASIDSNAVPVTGRVGLKNN